MKTALLSRFESSDHGTFGHFYCENFACFISELPWRDNLASYSCIPVGTYEVAWRKSPKFGWCYQVLDVPGRGHILIHKGNYVGDRKKKLRANSYGCLLPARKLGVLNGQRVGLISYPTVQALNSFFYKQTFRLEIKNADNSLSPL